MWRKLCCSKADKEDGDERPPSHRVPAAAPDTATTPPKLPAPEDEKPAPPRDLWKEAHDSLGKEKTRYLKIDENTSTSATIDHVIETTTKKYEEWQKGALKIRGPTGKDIDVRKWTEKILNGAMQSKDLITSLVSYDATGYASGAWSVISLGMGLVQNGLNRRDAAFESSAYLADTLAYFTLIDINHRNQNVGSDKNLDDALLGVYTALLDYSAEVNKVRDEGGLTISQQPLTTLKATVESKGQGAAKWARLSRDLYSKKLSESTLVEVEKSVAMLKSVESKTLSAEEERILQWVSKTEFSKIQNETQELRHADTGNWILSSEKYQAWKSAPGSILWLPGIVGCGKSVLCSTVIQDIEHLCKENQSKKLAYWYFKFDDDETKSIENLIRSLIRQFSRKPLEASVTKVWEENSSRGSQPNRNVMSNILEDVLSNSAGEMFLVLDALDECPKDLSRERETLLSLLVGLAERHKDRLHILATSRPEKDIHAQLAKFPTVDLQEKLAQDVETFVRGRVGEGSLSKLSEDFQHRIVDSLLRIGERRFRWAALQIARLEGAKTTKLLEDALQTIPKTLEDTYRDALNKLDQGDQDLALSMLRLMCVAAVPLDVKTIADAASLLEPDDVVTICSSSLVTTSEDNTIRLAHFSVKEFLMVHDALKKDHWCRFLETEAHEALATQTLDLLTAQKTEMNEEDAIKNPFLVYAARNFHTHVAGMGCITPNLQDKVDRLFTEPNIYFNYIRMFQTQYSPANTPWMRDLKQCSPALFQASELGFKHTVELLVSRADPSTFSHFDLCNAFIKAALSGHVDVMEFLVEQNLTIPDGVALIIFENILCRRIGKERLEAVFNIIWNSGAMRSVSPDAIDERIVLQIVENGSSGFELVSLLLARREEVFIPVTNEILLSTRQIEGHEAETVELFFERCNNDIKIDRDSLLLFLQEYMRADMLSVIIRRRAADLPLDDEIISMLVKHADWTSMQALLEIRGIEISVTEELLIKAAGNRCGAGMIRFLFNRRAPGVEISESVFIAAAENYQGREVMECLLDELAPDTPLTEKVIDRIVKNTSNGLEMMNLILDRQQPGFVVSETILETAVSRTWETMEMFELLMNNGGADVPITENLVVKAAQNRPSAFSLIKEFLDLLGNAFPITDSVIIAMAKSPSPDAPRVLEETLTRFPDAGIPEEAVQAASKNLGMIPMLLDRAPGHVPIKEVLEQIGTLEYGAEKDNALPALKALLGRQVVSADESVIATVAPNFSALKYILLEHKPDASITQKVLVRAASNSSSMKLLMEKLKDPITITEEVILAAIQDWKGADTIKIIFDRLGSIPITRNVWRKAAIENPEFMPGFLFRLQRDLKPRVVLQDIWQDSHTDAETKATVTMSFLNLVEGQEAIDLLQAYPYDWEQKEDHGFENLIQQLLPDDIPSPETEQVAGIIVERCSNEVIERFLNTDHQMSITDKVMQAAERNQRANKEPLLSWLAEKRESA
ncbi:hypothetical protein BDV39DRAFT_199653 [Aspergillus sergii]|uniref:Nephrocystin 3-like N-terminal domain-containing protein n=1 Tax=Aspergillus sergii TaxID=1034303 RepID=A0A5N6XIT0_9EURO|nr:hypothetical protein BDV39DRAFT_199653 [Aspergillus sergii]